MPSGTVRLADSLIGAGIRSLVGQFHQPSRDPASGSDRSAALECPNRAAVRSPGVELDWVPARLYRAWAWIDDRVQFKPMQGRLVLIVAAGGERMAVGGLSEDALIATLRAHPELRKRVSSIVLRRRA